MLQVLQVLMIIIKLINLTDITWGQVFIPFYLLVGIVTIDEVTKSASRKKRRKYNHERRIRNEQQQRNYKPRTK